jgi:hypothetical protein
MVSELKSVALVRKQTIMIERSKLLPMDGVAWSAQRIPTAVNLDFLDLEPLIIHSGSSSVIHTRLGGPIPDPLLLRKSGSAGISGSVARNSDH